jgi:uncharacterized protein (DUF58 family)
MTRSASPRLHGSAALAALWLLAALALQRPELAVLAAPFAALVAVGLRLEQRPNVGAWLHLANDRALEDEAVGLTVELNARTAVDRLELVLVLPDGLEVTEGDHPLAVSLYEGEERELELQVSASRWGAYRFGDIRLRARGRLGLLVTEWRVERPQTLRIYPRPMAVRGIVRPLRTQAFSGNEVAREKGDGLEYADTRLYAPGDRLRSINWRASARRAELVVNEFHPERNTDVLLFLDSFAEARGEGGGTLDEAVRATAALASRYLARRDRVGLVTFGGILRWLLPGMGETQRYRIVDALLETGVELNYAWKDASVIPARVLPPNALVIAITPLLDQRSIRALLDLRARGHDLAILEISPEAYATPGDSQLDRLAHRLWLLRRAAQRARYQQLGVGVAQWDDVRPFATAVEEVSTYRRHARVARGS